MDTQDYIILFLIIVVCFGSGVLCVTVMENFDISITPKTETVIVNNTSDVVNDTVEETAESTSSNRGSNHKNVDDGYRYSLQHEQEVKEVSDGIIDRNGHYLQREINGHVYDSEGRLMD